MFALDLQQDLLDRLFEWLDNLSLTDWLVVAAILVGWLLPLIKSFWEKERERREQQVPGADGPIEPR